MLFSPILSYITYGLLGLESSTYYFQLIFCFFGLFFIIKKWKRIHVESFHYFFAGYSGYLIIWSFYNGFFEQKGFFNSFNLNHLSILMILIIIYNTKFNIRFITRTIFLFKITVIVAAVVSLVQVFNYSFLDASLIREVNWIGDTLQGKLYLDRRLSIFGYVDPNELGLSYMPLLAVVIGFLLFNKEKGVYYFLILGGISAFLSNNRYVMIAFLIIGLQIMIFQKIKLKGFIKYILLTAVALFVLYQILSYLGYNMSDWYNERLLSEGSLRETTRYKAFGNFIKFFPRAPFFGTGVHITKEIKAASNAIGSSQIHVGYLAHLVSYGLVGSFLLFGFWFLMSKKLYKTAKLTSYWGSFFGFLIYLWAQATLVNYSIFFYGLIFAFIFDRYFRDYGRSDLVLTGVEK